MFVTPKEKKNLFLASSLRDGVEDNNLKQVTTLLDNNEADPNVLIPIYGITPFHLAVGNPSESFAEEVTKLFLRHGGNPNIRSGEGLTPVHVAAAWGRCKVLELLLSNGGDPLLLDNEGYNPFHFAFDGVHYDAIDILRKYCSDYTEEDEGLKYDIALEKLFINNKNMVAEYVVSDDQTSSTLNLSPENVLEININSKDDLSTSGSRIFLNDNFVTRRKNLNTIQKQLQENEKKPQEIDTDFGEKTVQEEKHYVSQIIHRLSKTFSNSMKTESTISDNSLYRKKMQNLRQMTNSSNCGQKVNEPAKIRNESPKNSNRGRLKSTSRVEQPSMKTPTSLKPERRRTKGPFFKTDATFNVPDHSIVSKSPNCNIQSRIEKKKELEKSPTIDKHNFKPLDNSIVSKSPNCAIISSFERKRKLSKTPLFEKNVTPKIVKKSLLKIISLTPCELKSKLYKSNSQKASQISKSLPRNFHITCPKFKTKRESPVFKSPVSVRKAVQSNAKTKDTEDSSGIYSSSSKVPNLKNMAMKLEDYMTEDFDSLSNNNNAQSTRMSESFEQEVLNSLTDAEENDLNTSLENRTYQLSESSSPSYSLMNSIGSEVHLKSQDDNRGSEFSSSSLGCKPHSKSNLSIDSQLSANQSETEDKIKHIDNSREKINLESLITEDLTERSFTNRLDGESVMSIEEEYKYKDFEEGVILMERRLCITPSCMMVNNDELTSFHTCSTAESVSSLPQEMLLIDKQTLRKRLTDLGENPGPITNSTHRVYLKRLMKLEDKRGILKNAPLSFENTPDSYETNTIRPSLRSLEWQKDLESYKAWENKIFQEFARPDPSRKWREGLTKASFNYLLLDSRITQDLPNRSSSLSLQEKWETFLSAIFYVGKGKKSRPYAHLYDAFHMWVSKKPVDVTNKKIKQILEIWNEKQGVVVLHVFHNTIPVEAYTREAVMIDALGVEKLGNCKGGGYYGTVATWSNKEKCELGKYLLYKSMEILMAEGERHLFPEHL